MPPTKPAPDPSTPDLNARIAETIAFIQRTLRTPGKPAAPGPRPAPSATLPPRAAMPGPRRMRTLPPPAPLPPHPPLALDAFTFDTVPLPRPPLVINPDWQQASGQYSLPRTPWRPLTTAEFNELRWHFPNSDPDRAAGCGRPRDLRRVLDAVFWVACSSGPWRALPEAMGKPDTASRNLRRWAQNGVLATLFAKATGPYGTRLLQRLAFWIARAFRRMARVLGQHVMRLAIGIGAIDAWPANPVILPEPDLSETAKQRLVIYGKWLKIHANDALRAAREGAPRAAIKAHRSLRHRALLRWREARLMLEHAIRGNRRQWRLK